MIYELGEAHLNCVLWLDVDPSALKGLNTITHTNFK